MMAAVRQLRQFRVVGPSPVISQPDVDQGLMWGEFPAQRRDKRRNQLHFHGASSHGNIEECSRVAAALGRLFHIVGDAGGRLATV